MKTITAGHKTETGTIITPSIERIYNQGVKVYNDTSDPELGRALARLWNVQLGLTTVSAVDYNGAMRRVMQLVAFWTIEL